MAHRPENLLDTYTWEIVKQEKISDNRYELTAKTVVEGTEITVQPPAFTAEQIKTGRYEKHICKYIDRKLDKMDVGPDKKKPPNLEGRSFESNGYDLTGPDNEYPDK